jgi:NADH:ubiquinone reductase (H+-translocating)
VATIVGVKLRGFPAWFAARTYHLMLMPGAARRTRLMADWTVGLLFGRSSSELGQLGHPPDLKGYLESAQTDGAPHETSEGDRTVRAVEG